MTINYQIMLALPKKIGVYHHQYIFHLKCSLVSFIRKRDELYDLHISQGKFVII